MKLVKALALLLVPLLLTSFLTVMPVAHADKPMPLNLMLRWEVSTGVFIDSWMTGPVEHHIWTGHYVFFAPDDTTYSCPLGYADPIFKGIMTPDGMWWSFSTYGAIIHIENSCGGSTPLDDKTGDITANMAGGVKLPHYVWEFTSGTGDLVGIHGHGIYYITGFDGVYAYYPFTGEIHFTG